MLFKYCWDIMSIDFVYSLEIINTLDIDKLSPKSVHDF